MGKGGRMGEIFLLLSVPASSHSSSSSSGGGDDGGGGDSGCSTSIDAHMYPARKSKNT